jgi:hypothetical protein
MPGYMPVFYFRTCDVTGKIDNMKSSEGNDVQMAMPGDNIDATCELIAATPIEKGMRFAMREALLFVNKRYNTASMFVVTQYINLFDLYGAQYQGNQQTSAPNHKFEDSMFPC